MAIPAVVLCRLNRCRRLLVRPKPELDTLARLTLLVLHFADQLSQRRLIASAFVDRSMRRRFIFLEHKHGLVWPLAVGNEVVVSRGVHKDVRKLWIVIFPGAVTHAEP